MNKLLKIEVDRLIELINRLSDNAAFNAYVQALKDIDNLEYPELRYYLEKIQGIINDYGDSDVWREELDAVSSALALLENAELEELEEKAKTEPLKPFWNSFKLWTECELPYMGILKSCYLTYDGWNGGSYYLNIDMSKEFKLKYGLEYDNRFENGIINIDNLKLYIELFYNQFVEDRYMYTKLVNDYFVRFRLPYKLVMGRLIKKGYKTSETNPQIINFQMLESKILWAEDRILGNEVLDKHTALNYITDSLEYILSIVKLWNNETAKIDQQCAKLVCSDENSKVYAVVKTEINEIQKIANEYFDIRHNEYNNKSKANREPLKDSIFIEYLYNRIYSIMMLLKIAYTIKRSNNTDITEPDENIVEENLPL